MEFKDAMKQLLKDNNKTQTWLSEKMGYTAPAGLARIMASGNPTLENLTKICELLDYEISIQPKRRAGSRPQGQIVIESAKGERK